MQGVKAKIGLAVPARREAESLVADWSVTSGAPGRSRGIEGGEGLLKTAAHR
jgi:hypothetical protein